MLVLAAAGAGDEGALAVPGGLRSDVEGQPLIVLRTDDAGVRGFECVGPSALIVALEARLDAAGAVPVEDDAADALRIEAGLPRFGPDMAEDTIPLEAGIEARAISFNKGCYVGQEVIIRVLHRGGGRVAQKLVGLRWPAGAQVPPSGTVLRSGGADIGSVTSSAYSPACGCAVALAYLKRDFIEPAGPCCPLLRPRLREEVVVVHDVVAEVGPREVLELLPHGCQRRPRWRRR